MYSKDLFTILGVTFEPFELYSYVTTHLKAKNPLYNMYKEDVGFLNVEFWENGACSLVPGKFLKLIWSQKGYRTYQLGLDGKNKSAFYDDQSSFPIFRTRGKPLIF